MILAVSQGHPEFRWIRWYIHNGYYPKARETTQGEPMPEPEKKKSELKIAGTHYTIWID